MRSRIQSLIDHQRNAALGQVAPAEDVPVGFMVLATALLYFVCLRLLIGGRGMRQ